jgi:hypothetical protein
LIEGPVPISRELKEGDTLSWDQGKTIRVFETPGHSVGSLSFLLEEEGVLVTGDAILAEASHYVDPRLRQSICSGERFRMPAQPGMNPSPDRSVQWKRIRYLTGSMIVTDIRRYLQRPGGLSLRALERMGIKTNKVLAMVRTSLNLTGRNDGGR